MNFTPNSFSDGGELGSVEQILARLNLFGQIDALDLGAESTAPMNSPITWEEEWARLGPVLKFFKSFTSDIPLSIDTYHPETIFEVMNVFKGPLIWNDVSGKFDDHVWKFLKENKKNQYVFCHNLAPNRDSSGAHMNYLSDKMGDDHIDELVNYFRPHLHPQVILDPTFGFSKTLEQNWFLLRNFPFLQNKLYHDKWLLGFSRKSFLRNHLGIKQMNPESLAQLDNYHGELLSELTPKLTGTVWIRTHRPELIS